MKDITSKEINQTYIKPFTDTIKKFKELDEQIKKDHPEFTNISNPLHSSASELKEMFRLIRGKFIHNLIINWCGKHCPNLWVYNDLRNIQKNHDDRSPEKINIKWLEKILKIWYLKDIKERSTQAIYRSILNIMPSHYEPDENEEPSIPIRTNKNTYRKNFIKGSTLVMRSCLEKEQGQTLLCHCTRHEFTGLEKICKIILEEADPVKVKSNHLAEKLVAMYHIPIQSPLLISAFGITTISFPNAKQMHVNFQTKEQAKKVGNSLINFIYSI